MRDAFQARWRAAAALIFVGFVILVARLWYMQLSRWYEHARRAARNRTVEVRVDTPRGEIRDRCDVLLATNEVSYEVQAVPGLLPKAGTSEDLSLVARLTDILSTGDPASVSTIEVRTALEKVRGYPSLDPATLPGVGEYIKFPERKDVIAKLAENRALLPGIEWRRSARRAYPYYRDRCVASHLIGYAKLIDEASYSRWRNMQVADAWRRGLPPIPDEDTIWRSKSFFGRLASDYQFYPPPKLYSSRSVIGMAGIERLCEPDLTERPPEPLPQEPVLAGLPGQDLIEVDARRRPLRRRYSLEGRRGADVILTIDARLQYVAEQALNQAVEASSGDGQGAAVLVDVNTGEVLAMASAPLAPDPNLLAGPVPKALMQQWLDDPRHVMLEKTTNSAWKPGSIFKIITAAAALETLKINPDFMSFCSGSIEVGQRKFRCWFPAGHGWVDFYHAMAVSCNVYFYQLVHDTARFGLSSDQIAAMARNFGLGEKTGIGLSERAGTVPSRDYKLERYGEQWYEGDTLLFATGDMGLLEVTPMQMAMVTAAVANGGRLLRPHVIRELRWPAPDRRVIHTEPEVVRKLPVSDATWAKIRRGMYLAVNNPIGTGYHHVRFPGVTIAGKSGSAEGKQNEKSHAWFAAFAPYDHPRYACVVLVSRGGYGGVVAGPVVRRILQAAFAEESPAVVAERNRPKASG